MENKDLSEGHIQPLRTQKKFQQITQHYKKFLVNYKKFTIMYPQTHKPEVQSLTPI